MSERGPRIEISPTSIRPQVNLYPRVTAWYLVAVETPRIAPSARNHGVSDHTMLHAFNNPICSEDLDEGLSMLIGPDRAGNLFEVGVVDGTDGPIIADAWPPGTST